MYLCNKITDTTTIHSAMRACQAGIVVCLHRHPSIDCVLPGLGMAQWDRGSINYQLEVYKLFLLKLVVIELQH